MSQPVAPPVVFDPHHFPNYTSESIQRDFTLFIYGLSIYEMFLCLNAYFKVCNKLKMKTPIFRLMTVAIFSMFVATLLLLLLQLNLTRMDLITNLAEYALNITDCTFLILDQLGYYIAATIRTRALLQKFPKTLYCFYFMLTITVITQFILMGFLADVYTRLYNTTAENFLQTFPITTEAIERYKKQATFTTVFNMVFANALAVSFLYPIFQTLEMDFFSAIKAMIKLGDVQKVLVFSASSIVCVGFVGFEDPQISLAVLTLWLNTQNTQFLQLSYFSSAELLATHSKAGTYNRRGQSATKTVESASHQVNSVTVAKTAKVENV